MHTGRAINTAEPLVWPRATEPTARWSPGGARRRCMVAAALQCVAALFWMAIVPAAQAQLRAPAGKRVALVVSNDQYDRFKWLRSSATANTSTNAY